MDAKSLTDTRLASAPTGGLGLAGPEVAAAADGVWISYATGMLGAVEHRSATGLAELLAPQHQHTNGIHVFVFGGTLWLVDGMAQQGACGGPLNGGITASSQETAPEGIVAAANGRYLCGVVGDRVLSPGPF